MADAAIAESLIKYNKFKDIDANFRPVHNLSFNNVQIYGDYSLPLFDAKDLKKLLNLKKLKINYAKFHEYEIIKDNQSHMVSWYGIMKIIYSDYKVDQNHAMKLLSLLEQIKRQSHNKIACNGEILKYHIKEIKKEIEQRQKQNALLMKNDIILQKQIKEQKDKLLISTNKYLKELRMYLLSNKRNPTMFTVDDIKAVILDKLFYVSITMLNDGNADDIKKTYVSVCLKMYGQNHYDMFLKEINQRFTKIKEITEIDSYIISQQDIFNVYKSVLLKLIE
jgi:hypothetical protein